MPVCMILMFVAVGILGCACLGLACLARRRARESARRTVRQARARDVYTLHPGTVALWDAEALARGESAFRGYRLPSGRVVRRRYWRRLEGVDSAE